jgi:hypothetical protein
MTGPGTFGYGKVEMRPVKRLDGSGSPNAARTLPRKAPVTIVRMTWKPAPPPRFVPNPLLIAYRSQHFGGTPWNIREEGE